MNEPNPKQQYGDRKIKLQLVPPAAAIAIAKGLEEGVLAYGAWNWREQPVELMTYFGAIQRHLAAWLEGENTDPDSVIGKTHLDGAIASLAILIDAQACGTAIDNRPQQHAAGALGRLAQGGKTKSKTINDSKDDELTRLQREIAYNWARAAIISESAPRGEGWFDTSVYDQADPIDELRYLGLRGLLEWHPNQSEWVRLKEHDDG